MIRFLQSGNKAAKYILGGLMLILAASMVIYLIPGFMSESTVNRSGVIASVGGEEVTADAANRELDQIMRQQGQQLPDQLRPIFMNQAVQRLIQTAEIRYEAQRLGLNVSDQEVREELQYGGDKDTFFPGGKWIGQERYRQLLSEHELSVDQFESQLRTSLLARKLFTAVGGAVSVSAEEVEKAYKDQNLKVKFRYALLTLDNIQKTIKPTDTELKAFFDANKARYQNSIPEKRQVRYFVLQDKDQAAKVTVDPSKVQRYYIDHQNDYRTPERVRVRHILVRTPLPDASGKVDQKAVDEAQSKAEAALKELKGGANFADLVKKYSPNSGEAEKGGEIGWVAKGQLPSPEEEQIAFSQNPGQYSGVLKTILGYDIIQTEEKEPAHVKPLDEVRAGIEQMLKQQATSDLLNKVSTDAEDMATKQDLDKAAAKYGAPVVQTTPIKRTDTLAGVGPSPQLMTAIFNAAEKSPPQVERVNQGYVIFQVIHVEPPKSPTFEEAKDVVTLDFKSEKAGQLLTKKTAELADRAHAEHDLDKAAKEAGAVVKESNLVGRQDQVPEIGSMSGPAQTAFSLKPGEISGPVNTGRNGVVLQLTEKQEPSVTDQQFAAQRDQLREQLTQQKQQESLQLFVAGLSTRLEKEGKLKINKNELSNMTKARS